MRSQREAILHYLQTHKTGLTTLDMMLKLGIASPTKRISELRREGHKITDVSVRKKNRYGRPIKFKVYSLKKGA